MSPGSTAAPPVHVRHAAVPGRVRLEVPGLRSLGDLARALEDGLGRCDGVTGVEVRPLTGSVLVLFDRGSALALADRARELVAEASARGRSREETIRDLWREREAGQERSAGPDLPRPPEPWHVLGREAAARFWGVDPDTGLSPGEVEARLHRFGPNRIPVAPPPSALSVLVSQFESVPVLLLLGSAGLSVATGGFSDAAAILAVVALNAGIGTWTETRSARQISALPRADQPRVRALRDGESVPVHGDDLVVGDVLLLSRGVWVPADARLVEARGLAVDESALTGESMPVPKSAEASLQEDVPLADRRSMVYRGTMVTGGSGRAVVVATGLATEAGRIQGLVNRARKRETPIERQLAELGHQLAGAAGAASGAVFVLGLARGYSLMEIFKTTVSLAVASIPEGLPTVATTTLAFGVRRMRKQGVLIRRLEVAEALGAVQVVCLDKTGTLTTNRMETVEVHAGGAWYRVEDGRFFRVPDEAHAERGGRVEGADDDVPAQRGGEDAVDACELPELRRLLETCVLNSTARLGSGGEPDGTGAEAHGSPTEAALLRTARDAGLDLDGLRNRHRRVEREERTEERMHLRTLHEVDGAPRLVAVKGRPDEVLGLCSHILRDGEVRRLEPGERSDIEAANERMGGAALRVLGVAFREWDEGVPGLDGVEVDEEDGLVWLGLTGIEDPVRPGAREMVRRFREAGIRPVMITGDQSATAYAVARTLDLAEDGELEIIDSTRLEDVEPTVLAGMARKAHVFSRVSPAQKLLIVEALQQSGTVVAMTGDGINDGPALRKADVGIALRTDGAEVAQEIADVILAEGDLEGILDAVAQGRTLADDIGKSVHYIAATNLSEVLFTLASVAGGGGVPLNPKQLLWINLLSDVFPELALSVEPPESDVLARPPRDPGAPIIPPGARRHIAAESAILTTSALVPYAWGVARYGVGPHAGTLAFMSLTTAQLLHTVTSRSETHSIFHPGHLPPNRWVSWALGAGVTLQVASGGIAGLRRFLGNTPLGGADVAVAASSASASFVANELLKLVWDREELRRSRLQAPEPTPSPESRREIVHE